MFPLRQRQHLSSRAPEQRQNVLHGLRLSAGPKLCRLGRAAGERILHAQHALHVPRHGGTGVDYADRLGHQAAQQRLDKRVMSAAQNQRIAAFGQ